jgi:hypothetical protein
MFSVNELSLKILKDTLTLLYILKHQLCFYIICRTSFKKKGNIRILVFQIDIYNSILKLLLFFKLLLF